MADSDFSRGDKKIERKHLSSSMATSKKAIEDENQQSLDI